VDVGERRVDVDRPGMDADRRPTGPLPLAGRSAPLRPDDARPGGTAAN
jgi:hypothetical protein